MKKIIQNGHKNQNIWHKKYLTMIRKSKVTLKFNKPACIEMCKVYNVWV